MLLDEIKEPALRLVSGRKASDFVALISQFHRIQGSPGIDDAIQAVHELASGYPGVKSDIFSYDIEGKGSIETWDELYAWQAKSATLELLEPESRILADYQAEPISLVAHSQKGEYEGEVVYVGKGLTPEDYEGKEVRGKLILTESKAARIHRMAFLEQGAAGVLTYVPPKGNDEIAQLRRYEGFWPEPGTGQQTGFGFALRQADGVKLKKLLESGKEVRVKASVDSALGTGKAKILSALIEGKDPSKEYWIVAHICHPHPGANDNASGAGSILEALRVIARLVGEGTIPQLQHSIRFLWIPEWHGTIRFIDSEKDLVRRCRAVVNADMVGADPCKSGSVTHLFRTPYSVPSTLNNVVKQHLADLAEKERKDSEGGTRCPLAWKYDTYSAGSDHFMFTDSTLRIPAIMLNQHPDRFYHTSEDTMDKIDNRQMGYVSGVVVLTALTLAIPDYVIKEEVLTSCRNEVIDIVQRVGFRGVRELSRCLDSPEKLYPRYMRWLEYAFELGRKTLEKAGEEWPLIAEQKALLQSLKASLEMSYTTEMMVLRKAYEGACAEVGLEAKDEDQLELDPSAFDIEVKRKIRYAMSPSYVIKEKPEKLVDYAPIFEEDPRIMNRIDELLNLSEDWTSLSDIYDRLCFQFGPFDSKTLWMLVKDLEEVGVLETRET
ncbi:DUF4910 domain-containing protein [Candidatus Thorarchaeota archaeon]|nr:MAG: DUF4910 domain-containing protein [Candidatus Thorarchaeota archaeon]